jgi:hypothetical protein
MNTIYRAERQTLVDGNPVEAKVGGLGNNIGCQVQKEKYQK